MSNFWKAETETELFFFLCLNLVSEIGKTEIIGAFLGRIRIKDCSLVGEESTKRLIISQVW